MEGIEEKKPLKKKNLKIIDHLGTYYATFDGSQLWKIEDWLFKLLKMCNGKKTFKQIVEEISKSSGLPAEDIKIALKSVFEELEKFGFIVYV
jgi:hypothetical protein